MAESVAVPRGRYRLHAEYTPGTGTPVVLMHGFPDNLHLYDRLLPHLAGRVPVVRFDFLGWGGSDKPRGYPYTADRQLRAEFVPILYADFGAARPAFWRLNDDLLGAVLSRLARVPDLRRFDRPVRIVFGARDRYLNRRVAARFHDLFPHAELHLLPDAGHYVQVDEPAAVAAHILQQVI